MKNTDLVWAKGLIYFPPIWPFKGSLTPSRTYADVMRRERQELYMHPADVVMADAIEETGLFWECLTLDKRMAELREKELVNSNP